MYLAHDRLARRLQRVRLAAREAPVSLVGTYAFVNPVVAVLLGWIFLDEQITLRVVVAAAVIVVAVALIVSGQGRAASAEPEP